LPGWLNEVKSNYDVILDGYSKRIEEEERILNQLIKEKETVKS